MLGRRKTSSCYPIFALTQEVFKIDSSGSAVVFPRALLVRLSRPLGLPARCTRGGSHEIQKIEIDHEDDMFGRICDTRSIDRTACFPCAAARRIVSSKLSPGAGT